MAKEFDWNADPESLAARAAELSLEQHDRLRGWLKHHDDNGMGFYSQAFEVGTTNHIASMMCAYAVLKGYVTLERAQEGFKW